jgi:uncharacterized membrane protein
VFESTLAGGNEQVVGLYAEKPLQPHVAFVAAADVCPVHCWVASLLSMDSMTLAMSFMTIP